MIKPESLKTVVIECDHSECREIIEVETVLHCLDIVPKFEDIQAADWIKTTYANRYYCPAHHM